MATMTVEVVSAERALLSVEAEEVYARTLEGEIGILPGHQPALLALDIGVVRVKTSDGGEEQVAVHHGFLYFRNNELVVLADLAEVASQIDEQRAERRLRELESRRAGQEDASVQTSIRKQQLRLSVVRSAIS
jgi:F-type H+-transporting ATPase subunit epsilon